MPDLDVYEYAVQNGLPPDSGRYFDCHAHLGQWPAFHIPDGSAEALIAAMDSLGIDQAVISAFVAFGADFAYGNDLVLAAAGRHPERLLGYAGLNPHDPAAVISELNRCFANPHIIGIKLHPNWHQVRINHPGYQDAYRFAAERRCPVLVHVWGCQDVEDVTRIVSRYPEIVLIMGHAGARLDAMAMACDLARQSRHLYLDTALSLAYEGNIEWLCRQLDSKKILFGSDMPFYDPAPTIGRIALADISPAAKADIFYRNMKRILKQIAR